MPSKMKLLLVCTILIFLSFAVSITQNIYSSYSEAIHFIKNKDFNEAKAAASQFHGYLEDRQHELFLYSIIYSNFNNKENFSNYITKSDTKFDQLIFIDASKNSSLLYSTSPQTDFKNIINKIDIKFLQKRFNSSNTLSLDDVKIYTSNPIKIQNNEYGMVLHMPIISQGKYFGCIAGIVSLSKAGHEILYSSSDVIYGKPFAIASDGYKILSNDSTQIGKKFDDPSTKPTPDVLVNYKSMAEGKIISTFHKSYYKNGILSPDMKPSTKILTSYPVTVDDKFIFSLAVISEMSDVKFFNTPLKIQIALFSLVIIYLVYLVIRIHKQILTQKEFEILAQLHENHAKELESLNATITEQNKVLNSNNKELKEYTRIKTDFFANISHELRMPLTVILSSTQLMEKQSKTENYSDKTNKWIKIIKQNSQRLSRLVNNLLTITKLDSGNIIIDKKNTDIINFMKNLIISVEPFIESKGLKVRFVTDCIRKIAAIDKEKFEKVILNILSNAIKFNVPKGEIFVSISCTDKIYIEIKDTGIGIPKEKLDSIFDRFVQVNPSLTREHEGTGIGLATAKEFLKLHNGDILAESELGVGSKFTIFIPDEKINSSDIDNSNTSVNSITIELSDIS